MMSPTKTLRTQELNKALKLIEQDLEYLLEEWHGSGTKQTNEKMRVKRYKIQHSIDEYTFPKEAYIHTVKFDDK